MTRAVLADARTIFWQDASATLRQWQFIYGFLLSPVFAKIWGILVTRFRGLTHIPVPCARLASPLDRPVAWLHLPGESTLHKRLQCASHPRFGLCAPIRSLSHRS